VISTLLEAHCELGENPLWDGNSGCLFWTDIPAGKLHRLHVASGRHEVIYQDSKVGGFTFQEDGDLLLFRVEDIAVLHRDGSVETVRPFDDAGAERFNDVIADPEGRVYAGTIGCTDQSGGLYRLELDRTLTLIHRGTGVSNGMAFSPDLHTFYWTCSTTRKIHAYDYDRAGGALSNDRVIYAAPIEEGTPDGMTVDSVGHLWSARWNGSAVIEHAPDGRVISRHAFPAAKVTSLCLGGEQLDEFFVTTAGGWPNATGPDGNLFRFPAPHPGRPEFRSRIRFS
jgi:sugar lactone lactonase YvrE